MPTQVPNVMTFSPTSAIPSQSPTPTDPSVTPTFTDPSISPTSTLPSKTPTFTNPTISPTYTPTLSPTDDCPCFIFGSMCNYVSALDLMLFVDGSSNNGEFFSFTEELSIAVEDHFPSNSRLSIVQFSTLADIILGFDYAITRSEMGTTIRSMTMSRNKPENITLREYFKNYFPLHFSNGFW